MTLLKTSGIVLAIAVAGVLIAAATRSDTFRVQRSASSKAAPKKIFPLIDDLRRFNTWNPFEKKDSNVKGSYSGAPSGKGAAYALDGNKNVGKGTIEIVDTAPASLQPRGDTTEVTWAMQGPVPYVAKIIHLFIDMDRMIGTEFEAGLASLKTIAEKTP